MRSESLTRPRFVVGVVVAAVHVAGCVGPVRKPDVPSLTCRAVGVRDAIRFQVEGGPIDVPRRDSSLLTMVQATARTLANDPAIQAALARVRAAEADADQARLLPNPVLSIAIRPRLGPESAIISPSLSEDLIGILQRPRRASAADHRLIVAANEGLTVALNTLLEVQERYSEVQASEAQLAVLEERRKLLDRLLNLADARFEAGEGSRLDLTTVQAQWQNLQFEVAQKRIDLRESRLDLARLMGEPGGKAVWETSPWDSPPRIATAENAWIALALRTRSEIQSNLWELAALGDDVALSRFAPWEATTFGVEAERDVEWSVGPALSLPLPVFDLGQARRQKAVAAVIEGRHKLTEARRQVVEEVRKAYGAFVATQRMLADARTQLLPLQESRQRQAEAAYRAGESDLTTLLVAEEDLQDTRSRLVDFEQKTTDAFIRLQRAVGGPGAAAELIPTTAPATREAK